jgi:hypothetical protein
MKAVASIFGGGAQQQQQGPSAAERAAQVDAANKASQQKAEADMLAAISARASSRRSTLSFSDRLGG